MEILISIYPVWLLSLSLHHKTHIFTISFNKVFLIVKIMLLSMLGLIKTKLDMQVLKVPLELLPQRLLLNLSTVTTRVGV
jgi:hypothetical protein